MKKSISIVLLTLALVCLIAPFAFASEEAATDSSVGTMAVLGTALGMAIAAFGTGIGQGLGLGKACEGVARNPGASGKITTTLIIGLAMIESLAIYALLVCLGILINQGIFF
ncbi:MAG: ATP synthase F0 subunit C [Nitrospirota bacterium]|nr:MAG: ATP synthase F0 subunit C [Nitrospirota bacterium]